MKHWAGRGNEAGKGRKLIKWGWVMLGDCGDHSSEVTTHGARLLEHYPPNPVVTGEGSWGRGGAVPTPQHSCPALHSEGSQCPHGEC